MRRINITPQAMGFDIRHEHNPLNAASFVLEPDIDSVTYLRRNNEIATVSGTSEHIRLTLSVNGYSVMFKRPAIGE